MTDAAGMEASGPAEGGEGRGEQGCRETPVGPVSFTRGAAVQCGSGFALAVCADTGLVITSNPYTCTLSVFEITMSAPGTGSPSSRGPRTDGEGAAVDDSGDGKSSPQPSQSASPTFTLVRTIGRAGDGPLEFDRPCAGRACGRVHARAMSAPVGYSRPTRPSTLPHAAPGGRYPLGLMLNSAGTVVTVADSDQHRVSSYDVASGRLLEHRAVADQGVCEPFHLCPIPDLGGILVANTSGNNLLLLPAD